MNAFFWALTAAFIWGIVPIIEKAGLAKVDPMVGLFFRCWGVLFGIVILGLFYVKSEELKAVDIKTVTLLVIAGFLASFVAQIAFYHGLKIGDVSKVVPIAGSYYLVTFILGILMFKEPVTLSKVAGIAMICTGMFLLR